MEWGWRDVGSLQLGQNGQKLPKLTDEVDSFPRDRNLLFVFHHYLLIFFLISNFFSY